MNSYLQDTLLVTGCTKCTIKYHSYQKSYPRKDETNISVAFSNRYDKYLLVMTHEEQVILEKQEQEDIKSQEGIEETTPTSEDFESVRYSDRNYAGSIL